ncbi:MAG TPA: sulfotransferase [Rhodanobacteraceae bacterium]|nr:sulfotransferase [Rhodanobacteraceae bacterium]
MSTSAGSEAILVAGMHRSGTSAATRVLNLLGVELGGSLLSPGPGNPLGHWEHREVVAIHEELLRSLDMGWDDTRALPAAWLSSAAADAARERIAAVVTQEFSGSKLWAVKDPRLCRFLPLWIEVIVGAGIDLRVLFVVRHPAAVAGSLKARDGLDALGTHLRWLEHFAEAELATRDLPRAMVLYDDLVSDWRSTMERLAGRFELRWPRSVADASPEIEVFLSAGERHNLIGQGADPAGPDLTGRLYELCVGCARGTGTWSAISTMVDDYRLWAPTFLGDIGRRADEAEELIARLRNAEDTVHARDSRIATCNATIRGQERTLYRLREAVHGRDLQIQNRDDIIRQKDAAAVAAARRAYARNAQIAALREEVAAHANEIGRLSQEASLLHKRVAAQDAEITARGEVIAAIQATISWRITGPLRVVRRFGSRVAGDRAFSEISRSVGLVRGITRKFGNLARSSESRAKWSHALGILGARASSGNAVACLQEEARRPKPATPSSTFDVRAYAGRQAVILTSRHCEFVAVSIQRALRKIDVDSRIIFGMPEGGYEDLPHFVICPQMFAQLPALYVAFQMEQSVSARWFDARYIRTLQCAFAVLDYSIANIDALAASDLPRTHLFHVPLGYLPDYSEGGVAEKGRYDVLFYGDIHNDRRRRFVEALEEVCRVRVIHDLFGQDLREEIAGAKLIVNIHYYESALLETTRLWECVSLDKLVISERAANMEENGDLEPLVDFVDLNDPAGMVARVRYWLENDDARIQRVKANRKLARHLPNRFEQSFYRFLLAFDNVTFSQFWQLAGRRMRLPSDKLYLTLPEYSSRRRSFDRDNRYGFAAFAGLRHREPWVGCGMSYKLMAMLARKQRLQQVTICEDDVEFRPGFEHDFQAVLQELAARKDPWHVFSGLLADLHSDATILSVCEFHGRKFVRTDRLISMVFNVYHSSVFDRMILWNESDRDVAINPIDRYLERSKLTVVTCSPFLVGHKSHLRSTLWNVENEEMDPMIRRSERLLHQKIVEFMVAHDPAAAKPSAEVVELSQRKAAVARAMTNTETAAAEGGS